MNKQQLITFAGLYQAAALTKQMARRGSVDLNASNACIYSLFQFDAPEVEAIYDGLSGVRLGLQQVISLFEGKETRDMEITQYAVSLIQLERKLRKRSDLLNTIQEGLGTIAGKFDHFDMYSENIKLQIAGLYGETISTLSPKIMVQGEPDYLQNAEKAANIRSFLFAGIRSAMAWQQVGGRRTQLLFGRKKIISGAKFLLQEIDDNSGIEPGW